MVDGEVHAYIGLDLHSGQQGAFDHPALFKVLKTGKRWGKSTLCVFVLAVMAGLRRGVYWYIAPTYGQAEDIAWRALKDIIPNVLRKSTYESKLTLVLKNGSEIVLKGAENKDRLRGPAIDGVIFDEYAFMDEDVWPNIIAGQLKDGGFAYFISSPNPEGKDHFTAFCDRAQRLQAEGQSWAYWKYTIYDNPTLSRSYIEGIRAQCPDQKFQIEYMAEGSSYSGQLFEEFSYSRNIGTYEGENVLPIVRALDWGRTHPTIRLNLCIDEPNKRIYIPDEYVKHGNIVKENCEAINLMDRGKAIEVSVIDPSARKHDAIVQRSIIDEFWDCGVECKPGDNTDRGYDIVKMFLKGGVLKISPKCKNLIYELENLQWGDKENDDCTDALRYGCVEVYDRYPVFRVFRADPKEEKRTKKQEDTEACRYLRNANNLRSMNQEKNFEFQLPDWLAQEVA